MGHPTALQVTLVMLGVLSAAAEAADNAVADDATAVERAITAAAAARGCEARSIRALSIPHAGVREVACADGLIIWFRQVDGVWTLHPHG